LIAYLETDHCWLAAVVKRADGIALREGTTTQRPEAIMFRFVTS
jgi:hypothetical protein